MSFVRSKDVRRFGWLCPSRIASPHELEGSETRTQIYSPKLGNIWQTSFGGAQVESYPYPQGNGTKLKPQAPNRQGPRVSAVLISPSVRGASVGVNREVHHLNLAGCSLDWLIALTSALVQATSRPVSPNTWTRLHTEPHGVPMSSPKPSF